jgi:hypothetical protein
MKLTAYITILLVASMLLVAIVPTASAQEAILAGVKPGDQFTYTVAGTYSSNAPLSDVPDEILNAAATEFFRITIVSVSSPNIEYEWVWHFTNGTERTDNGTHGITNIEIPSESLGPFQLMVSANLTTDESIHPHYGPRLTFNETVMWPYSNYTRATNRLQTETQEQNNQTAVTKYRTVQSDAYYDKLTGMLVSLDEETLYQNPSFTTSLKWTLSGQTAWTYASSGSFPPAPFWTLPVIIAVAIVIAFVVVALVWFVSSKRTQARRRQLLKKQ